MASTPSSSTLPIATPETPRQLAELLGESAARGQAISPVGGGSKLAFGNPLSRETERVSTRSLDKILAYEPDDMTISVEAGATIESVWRELAARGQTIPIEVPAPNVETIGGLIATGLCGPRRLGSGSLRDALIGIQAAYPDGTLGNAGGMVVKNVSGFDLMRMHLGALGTLGVVVSANFKVVPAARAEATVLADRASLSELESDRVSVGSGRIRPISFEAHRNGDAWRVATRIEGRPATVDQMARELAERLGDGRVIVSDESRDFWMSYVAREAFPDETDQFVAQLRDKPARTIRTLETALATFDSAGVSVEDIRVSLGLGTVRVTGTTRDDTRTALADAIRRLRNDGMTVLIVSAPESVTREVGTFGTSEDVLELMRQLKQQFDPRSVLNPGRVIPEL